MLSQENGEPRMKRRGLQALYDRKGIGEGEFNKNLSMKNYKGEKRTKLSKHTYTFSFHFCSNQARRIGIRTSVHISNLTNSLLGITFEDRELDEDHNPNHAL